MSSYSLDDIRTAADAKYGSTDIDLGNGEVVRLLNALRLTKDKRAMLMSVQDDLDAAEDGSKDAGDVMIEAIKIVAQTEKQAETLLGLVGDDLGMLAEIFERYSKGTQAGEASASAV